MSALLTKTQSTPNLSQPGLLYKTKQTLEGNCFPIWMNKADEQSLGIFCTSAYVFFFFSEENFCFPLRRRLSGEKVQKSGRAGCRSVTVTKLRNYLIYLIPRVCILGRIRINLLFFPPVPALLA